MLSSMTFRKAAIVTLVVLSSFAANTVAPSKSELESMYDKAFRAFDANNYSEALKQLDAIDARQPDLAESQNLRGVIFMRQGIYDKAEAALYRAVELDPKFWNARFNLAEIPFLQKNWSEARNRFQALLSSNSAELQGEATQLIQYKILLTYILEGKDNMVDSFLSKFELSNDTPAVQYGNAAIALQHKDDKAAKEWIAAAEKNFSPQLNKLFAESLYEVGWLKKPAGEARAALELTSAAERTARTKAYAKSRLDQAQQAFQKRDMVTALKLLDEADAADPNQPAYMNLRGEILMEQKDFDQAEAMFKKALKADPKYREAQFNLAQVPFKKKEYGKARDRLEALFAATPGGDKNQAAQLIKFKIFMTLLLEGKDSRAQKMMDQFQFTGDTPALYYAQAAWEFKHDNRDQGERLDCFRAQDLLARTQSRLCRFVLRCGLVAESCGSGRDRVVESNSANRIACTERDESGHRAKSDSRLRSSGKPGSERRSCAQHCTEFHAGNRGHAGDDFFGRDQPGSIGSAGLCNGFTGSDISADSDSSDSCQCRNNCDSGRTETSGGRDRDRSPGNKASFLASACGRDDSESDVDAGDCSRTGSSA